MLLRKATTWEDNVQTKTYIHEKSKTIWFSKDRKAKLVMVGLVNFNPFSDYKHNTSPYTQTIVHEMYGSRHQYLLFEKIMEYASYRK